MAFHELATNAAKYGALSHHGGLIEDAGRSGATSRRRQLALSWIETGGPPVAPPARSGSGSRLIRGLSHETGSEVRLEFPSSGITCAFELPLATGEQR